MVAYQEVAGARRWRWQFRCRGSRRETAAAGFVSVRLRTRVPQPVARHRPRGATHVYPREQAPLSLSSPARLARPLHTFMNTERLLFMFSPLAILLLGLAIIILPRRLRMERRARDILAQHPDAEQTSVYLQFHSIKWSEKRKSHEAMVADMAAKGWTFLRASEASLKRTSVTWAGGVTLHFIRLHPSHEL